MAQGNDDLNLDRTVTVSLAKEPNEAVLELVFCNGTTHYGKIVNNPNFEKVLAPNSRMIWKLVSQIAITIILQLSARICNLINQAICFTSFPEIMINRH